MEKLIQMVAVHEVVHTNAKGEREVVAPGKPFAASSEEADWLLRAGAAKPKAESAAARLPAPAEPKTPPVAPTSQDSADSADSTDSTDSTDDTDGGTSGTLTGVQDTDGTVRDLTKLRKPELLDIAKGMEIEGADGMTVTQLIEAIEAEEIELNNESLV